MRVTAQCKWLCNVWGVIEGVRVTAQCKWLCNVWGVIQGVRVTAQCKWLCNVFRNVFITVCQVHGLAFEVENILTITTLHLSVVAPLQNRLHASESS